MRPSDRSKTSSAPARSPGARLRDLFTTDYGLLLPGVPNALTALIAQDLGFDAVYLTGAGLTNTYLGLPDIGLISLPEIVANTAAVADAVDLPLVVDADTGFGNAIAVARTVNSEADILLLDEPLAAMGAKEGSMILDLVARLKQEARVSIIMILHNYVHVLEACDRVSMIQDGVIALDKPTSETSVDELTEIVVNEYRRARAAARG